MQLQRKSENPQEDPHGSHVGFSMLSQPWVLRGMPHPPQKGFSKNHTSELGEMSDHYLVQTYHFTDEICLLNLIPISHVALRLVSPGLSYRGWLEFFLFCFLSLEIWAKMTVSVSTTNNLLCPSVCERPWVLYLISHDMTLSFTKPCPVGWHEVRPFPNKLGWKQVMSTRHDFLGWIQVHCRWCLSGSRIWEALSSPVHTEARDQF